MDNDQMRKQRSEFAGLELHTLDSIERLALLQEQARLSRLGPIHAKADWSKIALAVGVSPRTITERGGMNGRLREAGIPNLTQAIRERVHGLESFTVDRAYAAVSASFPDVLRGQVHDAVMRMRKSGDVVRVDRGVYAPTARLRERVTR
ncbi:hypothetical protein [Micrococcus lylae]|uniref:hypothetical protein n=1 Tax=Micrococcus lylae TaxID=1273 RepID=UPI0021A85292|nr:hypothetical protein [Micrococcus lylae]MCT2008383.1 hypothetical protein [Micrococcus lylae]